MKINIIIFLLLATICQHADSQTKYGNNPAAGHYLQTRGIRLYYEQYGKGDPLLFIHGNGGAIDNFSNNIAAFSAHYSVIAVDSRAQGKSADPSDSLTFEQMADDFNALLDSLHLDSCLVIGWSDGGINGLLLAIRHPGKVRKLAITGANLSPDTSALTPFCYQGIIDDVAAIKKLKQSPEIKNRLKIAELDLLEPHIPSSLLHKIQCPTLVICGDHDVIPVRHTVLIAENIPKSYLWVIPNSGHSTPVFKKDLFNAQVLEFFEKPFRSIQGGDTFQ